MSITPITPTTGTLPGSTAQETSSASRAKPDADGDFDGSRTANDDAVKVTLSDAAVKALATKNGGSGV
jgi:hypothetical protein